MNKKQKDVVPDLWLIYTAPDNIQAEMILIALKNANIPALKKDLGSAGIMNIYGRYSKSGESIYVAKENVPFAKDVLAGMGLEP